MKHDRFTPSFPVFFAYLEHIMMSTELLFEPSSGDRQLFVDEGGIASSNNMARTMHRPIKKGAVIRPDIESGQACLQIRTAPIWDPEAELFKLWDGGKRRESADGLHWHVVGPHQGPGEVVYDAEDPDPGRRFKAFSPGGRSVSPDGVSWTKLDLPAVPSADEHNFSFDPRGRLFIATVKHRGPSGRSVWLAVSKDFDSWTDPELIFYADDPDQILGRERIVRRFGDASQKSPWFDFPPSYRVEIYNMSAFRYESHYIGMPMIYHQTGKVTGAWPEFAEWDISEEMRAVYQRDGDWASFHHVQLTSSRDLHSWNRLGQRQPFLDTSPIGGGDLDLSWIVGPSFPLVRGDELWFYYTAGKKYGGPNLTRELGWDECGICLAVLRRDGFVSLDAGDEEGTVTTRPFRFSGKEVCVNVDASTGELATEVIAEDGTCVCFSEPLSGDRPAAELTWQNGELEKIQGSEVALRFTARRARFYSYWIE